MAKEKVILFIYGVGGHEEQMKRLLDGFSEGNRSKYKYVFLAERGAKYKFSSNTIFTKQLRNKHSLLISIVQLPIFIYNLLTILFFLVRKYKISFIVSTGPGLVLPYSIFFKIFSKTKIIFVETWSRFYSKSFSGKFMYNIADLFFIQSQTLRSVYPKAKFSGRL